jgi:hypothetical protein
MTVSSTHFSHQHRADAGDLRMIAVYAMVFGHLALQQASGSRWSAI